MGDSTLQTVNRALHILELLGEKPMNATQIQNLLDLNKSTVHRLMMTLLDRGFVERSETTGIYQIGLKLVEVSSIRINSIELKTEAIPYLRKLAERVNQPVQLAIYDSGEAVYMEKIERFNSFRMYSQIGKRIPIYCSAIGKALVLELPDDEIKGVLLNHEMYKFTDTTLSSPEEVLQEISVGRVKGYTIDNQEHETGIFCIAAPIRDYRGEIVAAISTAGTEESTIRDENSEIVQKLLETAENISKRMGFHK